MKTEIFRSLEEARGHFGPSALAIGNFDGVHLGHQSLIAGCLAHAEAGNAAPAVLTFHPHPTAIVAPQRLPKLICSVEDRLQLLSDAGVRQIFLLPFTKAIAAMTPEEFVEEILVNALRVRKVLVGETFRFGHRQTGTAGTLAQLGGRFGFEPIFLPPVAVRREVVSSTAIRQHLNAGRIGRANRLLNRPFFLQGTVVSGAGVGSTQTVPTLNLRPTDDLVTPRGVFITETLDLHSRRRWESISNVGTRPTFGGEEITVETYLLSPFDGDTPRQIRVNFHRFVRSERQFEDAAALKQQILKDVGRARAYWRRCPEGQNASLRYTDDVSSL